MRKNVSVLLWLLLMTIAVSVSAQTKDQGKEPAKEPAKEQAKPGSVAGVWTITVQMQGIERPPADMTFTQEKEAIKVTMPGPQGTTMTGEGTVKESAVQWTVTMSGPQGDLTILFKGKVDGEKMTGEVSMGDYGTATWSATKKKT